MANLKLKLACADYDRTRPLKYGLVKPKGIDLEIINDEVHEIFWRMLQYNEFDVSEMSTSNYLTEKSTDNPRFIAIPVFLSRKLKISLLFFGQDHCLRLLKSLNPALLIRRWGGTPLRAALVQPFTPVLRWSYLWLLIIFLAASSLILA